MYIATILMTAVLLLCKMPVYAAPAAQVGGNADVIIRSCSVSHSPDADASVTPDGDSKVVMKADLSVPGEWACFKFTVENKGSADAILSDVIQFDDTPEEILISFGISDKNAGETLKAGEQCRISIVAQLDSEMTEDISADGDFALTLVYEAPETVSSSEKAEDNDNEDTYSAESTFNTNAPKTGDSSESLVALGAMLLSAVTLTFIVLKCRQIG